MERWAPHAAPRPRRRRAPAPGSSSSHLPSGVHCPQVSLSSLLRSQANILGFFSTESGQWNSSTYSSVHRGVWSGSSPAWKVLSPWGLWLCSATQAPNRAF